MTTLIISH